MLLEQPIAFVAINTNFGFRVGSSETNVCQRIGEYVLKHPAG